MTQYDIITVGGGLGGASLAKAMAERGYRVLVIEREQRFRDRVRGEAVAPWGVGEAHQLGIHEILKGLGGRELRWWALCLGSVRVLHRDLIETTPQRSGWLTFYHPTMQEALLGAAAAAGAEVRRGARVTSVTPGAVPVAEVERDHRIEQVAARLVVGADGRGSAVAKWAGLPREQDPPRMLLAGLLFDGMCAPQETFYHAMSLGRGHTSFIFPQGEGRVRAYLGYHKDTIARRIQGVADVPRFVELSSRTGVPNDFYRAATAAGPLATFDGADSYVEHPYRDGVALIGDAAASSDPTWGQGLSLTIRDARVLRDSLLAHQDWNAAGLAYAREHDRHYGVTHRVDTWYADLFLEIGPEADARRSRAIPLLAREPERLPDSPTSGPEVASDDSVRARFFGED